MTPDLLIVGGGITAATLCARLRDRYRVMVVETRSHLGGNCHDHKSQGTWIHQYGPHIFHSSNMEVVEFLSRFTGWREYTHSVTAEVTLDGQTRHCSFPYSARAARELGRSLGEEEILKTFFHGYSRKMWGREWNEIPSTIRARVPKDTQDAPVYFPGQFVALPTQGYSGMMEKMFDGVEVMLGVPDRVWTQFPARRVVYCGRPDRIPLSHDTAGRCYGDLVGGDDRPAYLEYVSLNFIWRTHPWNHESAVLNFCDVAKPYTRATHYASLTGGTSAIVGYELPYQNVSHHELAPFYPVPTQENQTRYRGLVSQISRDYPGLILAGRLGANKYLDMYQAVGAALQLADKLERDLMFKD